MAGVDRGVRDLKGSEPPRSGTVIDAAGVTCGARETALQWKDGLTGKVSDSDKLDGKDSSDFLGATAKAAAKAADADRLDGFDLGVFLRYADTARGDLGTWTNPTIGGGAVTGGPGGKVADSTLTGADIAAGSLTEPRSLRRVSRERTSLRAA